MRHFWIFASCILLIAGRFGAAADVSKTAQRVDELLAAENYGLPAGEAATPAALADDATFLRRVSLDITGTLPAPGEVTSFILDPSADKRASLVNRLLKTPQYGQNWARYWRDVIYMRRSDDRALRGQQATTDFLTQELNQDTPWDAITRRFITATGDVSESGECGIILAQMADPSNVTAEVSRIFMGVQIQCAQCHHHPFDRWKREQFHQMAAFFPRIGIRPVRSNDDRSFEVVSLHRPVKRRSPADTEGARLEYYMPDLNDPQAEGTLMTPTLYSTGQKLALGSSDEQRRTQLAEWLTARGNRWFAKAYVNRMWGELVGRGFQEPLDDLGPDRKPDAAKTFEYLADQFAASGYDHKWLIRVITATQTYQRTSRPRHDTADNLFTATCSQRLRGDQLFNALAAALGLDEQDLQRRPNRAMNRPRAAANSPRGQVNQVFGYDPSDRRDEVSGSIPQALFLMNSDGINRALHARNSHSALSLLLDREAKDENVVFELYLRSLAREPKAAELKQCLDYVRGVGNRAAAFEDIQWALINSTEFLYRK